MNEKIKLLEEKLIEIMRPTKELVHGQETKDWFLKIVPDAYWQLQIAALAHDIERAVPYIEGMTPPKVLRTETQTYDEYKALHAKRSAQIIKHIMKHLQFEEQDIKTVTDAIKKHEVGGDSNSDFVRDADSIRWFDKGYNNYISKYGTEGACEKGWWMYKRACPETKRLINQLPFNLGVKKYIKLKESEY